MPSTKAPRIAVSTWSLHHHLGAPPINGPEDHSLQGKAQKMLELPAQLAQFGIHSLEICHFHLPSTDSAFLSQMRAKLEENKVEVNALLIDGGDLNDAQNAARDKRWIESYLPVAAQLGARNARVIAGQGAPTPENIAQSVSSLRELARVASENGVRLTTENWFPLTSTPAAVLQILEEVEELGLCLDFGNWGGPAEPKKYALMSQIAPRALSCHTKAFFKDGEIEREDFQKCLEMMRDANFGGVHTLIYDSGGDEWRGLEIEREVVAPFLSGK